MFALSDRLAAANGTVQESPEMRRFMAGAAAQPLDGGKQSFSESRETWELSAPQPSVFLLGPLFSTRFAAWTQASLGGFTE